MASIATLTEETNKNVWSGTSARTGEAKVFQPLKDYTGYTNSLDKSAIAEHYTPGVNTTPTGFLEFSPRDPVGQAKYDAMQTSWEGVESSDRAIARGDYSLDAAETITRELRKPMPSLQMPPPRKTREDYCCLQ
jgi:hypothetical protein